MDNTVAVTKKAQAIETTVTKPSTKTTLTKASITTKTPPVTKANLQVSNSMSTVISQRTERREKQISHDKKRDSAALGDADSALGVNKKGMFSMPVQPPALTRSTHFPSHTPVPCNLGASGQMSTGSDSVRETEKEENKETEMDYEDY